MTVEKKKDIEDRNLKFFRRTDVAANHVIIFAHGTISTPSAVSCIAGADTAVDGAGATAKLVKTFKVPTGKHVLHYIEDHKTFTFQKDTWLCAFQGQLDPINHFVGGNDISNYELTKAAGEHIETEAKKTYSDLETEVESSDKAPRAVAPPAAQAHRLGLGVACDLVSIRNPNFFAGQSLKQVIEHKWMQRYTYFHCFFCRAHKDGKDVKSGPNWQGGKRQFK